MLYCRNLGLCALFVSVFLLVIKAVTAQPDNVDGYRLHRPMQFFLAAPKVVRQLQLYQCHVTLFEMPYIGGVDVRARLTRDNEQYAASSVHFSSAGTYTIQMLVPQGTLNGTHMLLVEGFIGGGVIGQPVFQNATELTFDTKYASIYVQLDKPLYYTEQNVHMRILGVTHDLMPVSGPITVYVQDGKGFIILRWLQQLLNFGMFEADFTLNYPVNPGTWTIRVDGFGHTYYHNFTVQLWWRRMYDMNITTQPYLLDSEWGLVGTLYGQHMSYKYTKGNATIYLQVRENGTFYDGQLVQKIRAMEGSETFEFSMKDIRAMWGDVVGKELVVTGFLYDWYFLFERNATAVTKVLRDGVVLKRIGRRQLAFKPGAPFTVYMALQRSDGTPFSFQTNRSVFIQESHIGVNNKMYPEKMVIASDDGIIRYTVMPEEGDTKIFIWASHCMTPSVKAEYEAYRYYSKNGHYLSITSSEEFGVVDEYMTFTIRMNFFIPEVQLLIMSGGSIITTSSVVINSKQKTITVAISRGMAPIGRALVYCLHLGEIITDSLNFFVYDARLDTAKFELNYGKNFRRDTIEIIAKGEPGGFVSVNGMDWNLYTRAPFPFLNREWLLNDLMAFSGNEERPFHHIWWYQDIRWEESVLFNAPTAGVDFLSTFELSGLVALGDLNLTVPEELHLCNKTQGLARCASGGCYEVKRKCDGFPDCVDGFDESACPLNLEDLPLRRPSLIDILPPSSHYFDYVDWAWRRSYVKPYGQVELSFDVPETNSSFVIYGYIIHPVKGLQLVQQPIIHDTSRFFYMTAEAPNLALRGEQIGVRLCIFNNWNQDLEIIVMLHGSDSYSFINVEDYGISNSYNPRTTKGDIQIRVEIEAGQSRYIMFPVLPHVVEDDCVVIFSAYSLIDEDRQEVTIPITYEGCLNDDFVPYVVDLINKPNMLIPFFDSQLTERFLSPEKRELLYVPGSNQAVMYVYGYFVQPSFYPDLEFFDANIIILLPHDTAEAYMLEFAYNLITMKYLWIVNQLKREDEKRILFYLKMMLMRQYAYMESDGSFKMWRRKTQPCVWLTAFMLKYFHKATVSEWNEDLYIPIDLLNNIGLWLTRQQADNGSFPETVDAVTYYIRSFMPYTTDTNGDVQTWHVPVTAYTTIALALATRLTQDAKVAANAAVAKAADYLASLIHEITDPFQMCIVTYALHVTHHSQADSAFMRMNSMKREGEYVYWAADPIAPNPEILFNNIRVMQTRLDIPNVQNAVMGTSYALLCYLMRNDVAGALPMALWLPTQHMDIMKYSSIQDTLLATEALAEFAFRQTNRAFYNMRVSFQSVSDPTFKHTVDLNYTNFAQVHRFMLDNAWGQVHASAEGTGYAYVQMTVWMKVVNQWQVAGPAADTLHWENIRSYEYGRNASIIDYTSCINWMRKHEGPHSSMVVIRTTIPTGYVVARETIEWMYDNMDKVPGLKRVRFHDQSLWIFIDSVTYEPTCYDWRIHRYYPVANGSIPQMVETNEYCESGMQRNTQFNTYSLSNLHVCRVCASFQCPYCMYYNASPQSMKTSQIDVLFNIMLCLFALLILLNYK